uniref:Uncharacterized protein n=1 Tax=Panagrolaimus superbus TaxID=310955 RepID=A0A914Y9U4_9BILA
MTETVHPEKSPSPFLSVFRKKRPSPAISAPGDYTNGTASTPPPPVKPPKSPKSPQMSFTQRVKMHKDLRSGKIPDFFVQSSQSQIIPSTSMAPFPIFKKGEKKSEKLKKNKALSADAINHMDPNYLTEALEAFGDEQPIVAR